MNFPKKKMPAMVGPGQFRLLGTVLSLLVFAALGVSAQQAAPRVQPRIQAEINTNQPAVLKGSLHPLAASRWDSGRMPANTELQGITLFFNRSAAQEKELKALIEAQQNPASPQYHKWLTPEEFGERFGLAQEDIAKVQSWLESEGFRIDSVNRARTGIHFSGTAAQVERSFATEMHLYDVNGQKRFAPATALSAPSAIAGIVSGIGNLHDLRPRPLHIRTAKAQARPRVRAQYTLNNNGTQYVMFAPGDIKVVYNMNGLIGGGNDGTGQTITILGQSAIQTVDITNFQNASGLPNKAPTLTLVPGTGASTLNPGCPNGGTYTCGGDEGESDLDIEWASGTAPGATVNFVYTGGTLVSGVPEYGVFDSYQYAVDQGIGNIISFSYGACETELTQNDFNVLEAIGEQATTQGQTVLAASGDQGSTACSGYTDLTTSQQQALAVNYPASSQYVVAVGGTEMTEANAAVGTYWSGANTNDITLTSAKSYIPEIAWNDDSAQYGLSSSGGGVSTFTARPSWQSGVTGIPSGTKRLLPDVSLYSSPNYPGYVFCSSDPGDWYPGDTQNDPQTASCGSGQFYDNEQGYFTIAGGTSFAAPIFAGMLAIVNQAKGYTDGQGLVNVELYKLASNSTTYASAFHDITSGDNKCTAGSGYCSSSQPGYTTTTGYDQVTGLGSVDMGNLVTAWPANGVTTVDTTTTVVASTTTPTVGTADSFTVTVAPASGTTAPTGTVAVTIDGTAITGSPFALTADGSNGKATFSYTFTTAGSHTVSISYSGDSSFNSSTGSTTVTASASSVATTTTVTAATTTPTVGTADQFTVTVAPASGSTAPTGTVAVTVDGTAITGSPFTLTASGSNATATFPITFTASGSHTVAATYSGSSSFNTSNGSTTVTASGGTTVVATTTAVSASNASPTVNTSDSFTVTVTPASGTTAPTGTVAVTVDGTAITGSPFTLTASGSNATATFSYTFATTGSHTVAATYSGDTSFSTSNGSTTVTAQAAAPGSFTLAFAPSTLTVSQGNSGTEALTVTPTNYVGTVNLTYTTSNDSALANMCIFAQSGISNGSIVVSSASTAVTGQLTVDTRGADCVNSQTVSAMALKGLQILPRGPRTLRPVASNTGKGSMAGGAALAGLLLMGFFGRKSRKLRNLAAVLLLAAMGLAISACGGGGGSSSKVPNPSKGTYTITFTGQDSGNSSIKSTGSFTLTID